MAVSALEEKINKIRQQNEEIKRRHEEVEEDKKNAAKLNALVQLVPSTDWPERKEPPEFSNPPRAINNKPKHAKEHHEHHEHSQQYHPMNSEGRKVHTFAQGQGPPPDPKYNFLADSEREEGNMESVKEIPSNRGQKYSRGIFRRKAGGRDGIQRDYRTNRGPHKDEYQPEYEAWRAERNRIDEDRISRQRTAEGNWRREWDNDKAHIVDEITRSEAKLGDYAKKEHKDIDKRYHVNGSDYAHHNRGGNHRSYRGNSRHFYNYESRSNNVHHQDGHIKNSLSPSIEERTVIATDKSIKVTLNQGNMKGPVMSVKVNSPNIAGTGRVGPRQRSRITYSSHSDAEIASNEIDSFSHSKSCEDKTKGIYHDNLQKSPNMRKSQPTSRKKDTGNKSPYFHKKEIRNESDKNPQKHGTDMKLLHTRKEYKESQKIYQINPRKLEENNTESSQSDEITKVRKSNIIVSDESEIKDVELQNKDTQNNNLNIQTNLDEIDTGIEIESVLQNSYLSVSKTETGIETFVTMEEKSNKIQTDSSECEIINTDLDTLIENTDNNDRNEIMSTIISSCDINNDIKIILENTKQDLPTYTEKVTESMNNNCNKEQNDKSEKEVDKIMVVSSIECPVMEENNELEDNDRFLKEKKTSGEELQKMQVAEDAIAEDAIAEDAIAEDAIAEDAIAEGETVLTNKEITTDDKRDMTICNEIQEHVSDNNEKETNTTNDMIDELKSLDENLQIEKENIIPDKVDETEK